MASPGRSHPLHEAAITGQQEILKGILRLFGSTGC
jgi:hypothetical protein